MKARKRRRYRNFKRARGCTVKIIVTKSRKAVKRSESEQEAAPDPRLGGARKRQR